MPVHSRLWLRFLMQAGGYYMHYFYKRTIHILNLITLLQTTVH